MSNLLQSLCSFLTVLQDHIKFICENVLYVEVMYDFTLFCVILITRVDP